MKKHDLIDLLLKIDGNPEIVLWNGFVGDYQHISSDMQEDYLTKLSFEGYLIGVEANKSRDTGVWSIALSEEEIAEAKRDYKNLCYEFNEFVTLEDIKSGRYKKKRVIFIKANPRGEVYHDRLGKIGY